MAINTLLIWTFVRLVIMMPCRFCAGEGGYEADVYAVHQLFIVSESQAVLLVDVSNEFIIQSINKPFIMLILNLFLKF